MGSPSRNVQYHPPRLSEDRLNLPQPHSPSLPTHCSGKSGMRPARPPPPAADRCRTRRRVSLRRHRAVRVSAAPSSSSMTVSILRLLGVRPRERGEPGAQLRVGLGGPAPGQRAPRAVEQQSPSEPVVSGQQRGAPPRLERDLAGRSDVRYADVSPHFVEPLDGFLNRSTVHPRPRGADPRNSQLVVCCWQGSLSRGLARAGAGSLMAGKRGARRMGLR